MVYIDTLTKNQLLSASMSPIEGEMITHQFLIKYDKLVAFQFPTFTENLGSNLIQDGQILTNIEMKLFS